MSTLWLSHSSQQALARTLSETHAVWLVTGAAGFIGSHLIETLLRANQTVVGLDNFLTGYRSNLREVERSLGPDQWTNFRFVDGDIRDRATCEAAVRGVEYVLHQAALGSVPRSITDPLASHDVNVTGFLNMLDASRRAGVRQFVYAASSSTYGDEPSLPKREERIGNPLSPYAVTKLVNEIYAAVYARNYGFSAVGLRYFNVFGPRQDPNGAYAAVIPRWTAAMVSGDQITINGDGSTSRDFTFVENAVQANLRAALREPGELSPVYNVAVGNRVSLSALFNFIKDGLAEHQVHYHRKPVHADFRPGDVCHSQADIHKATTELGYAPTHQMGDGLKQALPWYIERLRANRRAW